MFAVVEVWISEIRDAYVKVKKILSSCTLTRNTPKIHENKKSFQLSVNTLLYHLKGELNWPIEVIFHQNLDSDHGPFVHI